jgi:hypothetical protein
MASVLAINARQGGSQKRHSGLLWRGTRLAGPLDREVRASSNAGNRTR